MKKPLKVYYVKSEVVARNIREAMKLPGKIYSIEESLVEPPKEPTILGFAKPRKK